MQEYIRHDEGTLASLTKNQKEAVGLLSIGTFLEYFDLMLYVHMAAFLNELFFEPKDPHTASLTTAFAFCSTFVFRPIAALIFGWLGDNIGRRATVIITTFIMAISCVIMASLPTYAQIGISAAWIVTLCRAIQGISSMGEITGAELYLTETINPPACYLSVGAMSIFAILGEVCALGVASLVMLYGFSWRIAFLIGAIIALIGSIARTKLRETPEFADAKRRIKKIFKRANTNSSVLEDNLILKEKVNKKTVIAFFLLQCAGPVSFYFTYIHCGNILQNNFNYTASEIIHHNFIICIAELCTVSILSYLSYKIYPLLILKIRLVMLLIFILFCPYWLNCVNSPYELLLIQLAMVSLDECLGPAIPIFYKNFPVFKRFTCVSFTFAISRALMYIITSFGFVYITDYFGNWGVWIIMIPTIIGFAYGLRHFEKLVKVTGNYPKNI